MQGAIDWLPFFMMQRATALPYRGRFAPTPSGPLHFGSLVAALGSYLDARAHNGVWLVRIEDVDRPRCKPEAAKQILTALEQFGLHWDESVIYQSHRFDCYQTYLQQLSEHQLTYLCTCTRKQIKAAGGHNNQQCRQHHVDNVAETAAVRFVNRSVIRAFDDRRLGRVVIPAEEAEQDFILYRRDRLPAYQLAVVIDDIEQRVTDVVRGADLLHATGWQQALYHALGYARPHYMHLPLVLDEHGNKLSKQNHAMPLNAENAVPLLIDAMAFLHLPVIPALRSASVDELLQWGIHQWQQRLI